MRKSLIIAAAAALFVIAGCSSKTDDGLTVRKVIVTPDEVSLPEGLTESLSVTVEPSTASYTIITWTSSDTKVATISKKGTLTAISAGEATITATVNGVSGTCDVTVTRNTTAVTGIKLSAENLKVGIGSSEALIATVTPSDAANRKVTWSSSNPAIATVEDGLVTGIALGECDVTATTEDGKPVRIIRNAETNLGDLCADAYLDQAGDADIAFVNGGGIRVSIAKGDIILNDILKVHPFGNSLTVIEVTGQQVLDALEWSVHAMPGEFGGFNQVAGLTFEVNPTIPTPCVEDENTMFVKVDDTMERRVRNVLVAGEPIDPEKIYKLASINYQLLDNGDGYTMFDGCTVLQDGVKLDNQVLIDYITGTLGGVIGEGYLEPYGQGRIVAVE